MKIWPLANQEISPRMRASLFPPKQFRGEFQRRNKEARIRGLISWFANGQIFMLEGHTDLKEEYDHFPAGSVSPGDHLLDALAQGPYLWIRGSSSKQQAKYHKAEEELLATRDAQTGY